MQVGICYLVPARLFHPARLLDTLEYVRIFGEYSPSVAGDAFGHYIWCVNVQNDGTAG